MTTLANMLKGEITRLARKEIRTQLDTLRKATTKHRQDIAALKRLVTEQQRAIAALKRTGSKAPVADEPTLARFSAKGLRTLRSRLGLSAADFGRLAGVSGQSVFHWEAGKTVPRSAQKAALAGLRSLGKREAIARLEAFVAKPAKRSKR